MCRARPAEFQGVTPLMCALVQALLYVSVYLVVFVVLIGAGHALELITLPGAGRDSCCTSC